MADDSERPQYQHGVGTIGGSQFHWGAGMAGKYWSIPYGDYPVTPDAPTGAWAHQAGAIPIANNVIPDPQLGRNRIGIMIHSGSSDSLDQLYTQGCFKVAPQEWPAVRSEILKEASNGPLYLHVQPGGVAAFTNTKTFSQASSDTPAANANVAANTTASTGPSRPATPTPGTSLNTSPMDLVANLESGNRNIPQGIVDANTARGTPAGGYFQIIDPTWRSHAAAAGVDVNQYPTAMSAPRDIQAKVASVIPINQWGANTVNALKAKFPGVDTSQTLGALQSTVLNGGSGAPGPIDPSIIAHGGSSPAIPSTPGTTINSTPATATAGIGGQLGQLSKDPNVKAMLGLPDDSQGQGQQQIEPSKMIQGPGARNVSPYLGGPGGIGQGLVEPAYAQRMASLNQPMTWGSAPPGQMPGTGYGVQAQPSVYGTSLMSNLGRSLDPMWMNSWGT